MNLLAATLAARVARYLNERRYQLSPELSKLRAELGTASLELFDSAEQRLDAPFKAGPSAWERAHDAFWTAVPLPGLAPTTHRVALNPPTALLRQLSEASQHLKIFVAGAGAGQVSELLRLSTGRGEDQTFHVDDLMVFCLNGYEKLTYLVDVASIVKPGSTVTVYHPTNTHTLLKVFFNLLPVDQLLDALATRYKVTRLHEAIYEDWYTQVFGVE